MKLNEINLTDSVSLKDICSSFDQKRRKLHEAAGAETAERAH